MKHHSLYKCAWINSLRHRFHHSNLCAALMLFTDCLFKLCSLYMLHFHLSALCTLKVHHIRQAGESLWTHVNEGRSQHLVRDLWGIYFSAGMACLFCSLGTQQVLDAQIQHLALGLLPRKFCWGLRFSKGLLPWAPILFQHGTRRFWRLNSWKLVGPLQLFPHKPACQQRSSEALQYVFSPAPLWKPLPHFPGTEFIQFSGMKQTCWEPAWCNG